MNFALSAIILIILLLPGSVAIKGYYSSFKEKKSNIDIPVNDLLIKGIILSLLFHLVAVCVLLNFGDEVDFTLLYNVITGKAIELTPEELSEAFIGFSVYNLCVLVAAWVLSKSFKGIVQKYNLDLDFYSLRNTNYWFIVFSARYLEVKGIQGAQTDTDFIWIDALTDKDMIYSGMLVDFNYSPKKDELENVVLRNVWKRSFERNIEEEFTEDDTALESNTTGTAFEIPGDVFVLPMKQIINFNIHYVKFEGDI